MGVEGKDDVEHEAQGLLSCTNTLKRCLDIPVSERAEEEDGERQKPTLRVCVRFVNALIFPWNTNAELAMV
ncbi:hypothetical protein QQF64_030078 [Cirrhinus molitorella]|uniref:Uncharacterized protein n=1 Tax=Cirrhinus molitorella TaxID=172907 RepID=A0ABR3N2L9_9TELE